jgi:hypothetical protein
MSFADDLLEQAYDLAHKEPVNPKAASLRRSVSTAYYALFHLLIDQAVSKWAVERQRSILARTFEHGKMKGICDEVLKTRRTAQRFHGRFMGCDCGRRGGGAGVRECRGPHRGGPPGPAQGRRGQSVPLRSPKTKSNCTFQV